MSTLLNFLQSFVIDIVVAGIMFALGWLARSIYQYYRTTKPAYRVWQLKDREAVFVVTPNPSGYVGDEFSDTVFPTDYMAVAELRRFLSQIYPHLDISEDFAQVFPSQKIGEHVVLIGGEDINPVTELVFKRLRSTGLPLTFENDHIVDRGNGTQVFRPEVIFDPSTRRNELIVDYALVLGIPNPFEPSRRLYILAGCYVYGNLAAVQSVVAPLIRKVSKKLHGANHFVFLLKCSVLRRYVGNLDILRVYTFNDKLNRWESRH